MKARKNKTVMKRLKGVAKGAAATNRLKDLEEAASDWGRLRNEAEACGPDDDEDDDDDFEPLTHGVLPMDEDFQPILHRPVERA